MNEPQDCKPRAADRTPWQVIASRLISEGGAVVTRGLRYGPDPRHLYDLYEPGPDRPALVPGRPAPSLLFIYGGSWRTGERGCYHYVGTALARRGVRTIIADYRLYPQVSFPGFVEDMAIAYGHIAAGPDGQAGAPFIAGHSAGAHICGLMAGDPRYLETHAPAAARPAGVIGLCGPYAFDPTTWNSTAKIFAATAGQPDRARPIAFAGPHMPPALLLHGPRDTIVTPNASRRYHEALRQAGAQSELKLYTLLGHIGTVLAIARPLRWTGGVLDDMIAFIAARSARTAQAAPALRTAGAAPSA